MDCDRLSAIKLVLAVIDGFFRRLFATDTQRSEEPTVIGCQVKAISGGQKTGGRSNPSYRRSVVPAHKPNHSFERHSHVKSSLACLGSTSFNLSVLGDSGGNRVGQLFREPVHDVIHSLLLLIRHRAGIRGVPQSEPALTGEVGRD